MKYKNGGKKVGVYLAKDNYEEIDKLCKINKRTQSEMINIVLSSILGTELWFDAERIN